MTSDPIDTFIERWRPTGGTERGNYQIFLTELADLLGVVDGNFHANT